ncbi:GRIP and coiled-coil domain-containing protein 1 isoform X2 [Perca flavescens]|uniref:GRIP and coiled-coil domain-containing protein 1 isoform X2 n=1 Tax=Perca flavescens TaxID=8167 RepID=UPI00106ED84B|nr:GRIP and coiled-coil domain-containing protein 1 isoform X2 [Perca flavescens]
MEKFGMSFGGGRKELLDTIESQKKQLVQYQTRFKDVVQAYKSLLKEKEALEASLKVLSVSQDLDQNQPGPDGSEPLEDGCSLHSEDSVDTAASADTASETSSETARGGQSEEDPGEPAGKSVSTARRLDSDGGGPESGSVGAESQQQATPPPSSETERRAAQLKNQLSTLTSAIATVTHEKSRMEASFQADKRQLKQEVEELQERLACAAAQREAELSALQQQREAELSALQQQLAESHARVITQQHERERETNDHATQLRELQRILQQERALRQDAELRLQDTSAALLANTQAVERGAESEAHLSQVREERDELKEKLLATERHHSRPDPRLDELQRELTQLKNNFQTQTDMQTRKASEAEERATERAQCAERRAAGLEQRVSELSELLGGCEKARQRELMAAQRLRERIMHLDAENKTLAMAMTSNLAAGRATSDLGLDESQLDVGVLKEKLEKVKKLLQIAAKRDPEHNTQIIQRDPEHNTQIIQRDPEHNTQIIQRDPEHHNMQIIQRDPEHNTQIIQRDPEHNTQIILDLEVLPGTVEALPGDGEASAAAYRRELRQLRDEFERYKLRAQLVLKNRTARDGCQARELEEARDQLAELKEKYINLRIHADEAETRHRHALEERQQHAAALTLAHRQEVERLEALQRDALLRLEEELHKQRDRTLALLQEKDQELERLRAAAATRCSAGIDPPAAEAVAVALGPETEGDIIAAALRRAAPGEPTLLLYAEQLARKEAELGVLRRQKHGLDGELHRLQARLTADAERHGEEAAALREHLDKLHRDRGREGANMEYLKNVFYKFLTLPDAGGRQQTLGAILTVLHFSPPERQAVLRLHHASWWPHAR